MKKTIIALVILGVLAVVTGYILSLQKNPVLKNIKNQLTTKENVKNENQTLNFQQIPTEKPVKSGIDLIINEPKENAVFSNPNIKISGKTASDAEVFVNDKKTKADNQGNFSLDYQLDEGENLLTVSANDANGNYAEKEIVVYLQTINQ